MRPLLITLFTGITLILATPTSVQAQPTVQTTQNHAEQQASAPVAWDALDLSSRDMLAPLKPRWDKLPTHVQHHLMDKAKKWEKLPAYRQKRIRYHIQHWQQMSPADRRRVKTNQRIYMQLTPDERAQLHSTFDQFKQLPSNKQKKLRQQWRSLTPKQQKQWIRNGANNDFPEPAGNTQTK